MIFLQHWRSGGQHLVRLYHFRFQIAKACLDLDAVAQSALFVSWPPMKLSKDNRFIPGCVLSHQKARDRKHLVKPKRAQQPRAIIKRFKLLNTSPKGATLKRQLS